MPLTIKIDQKDNGYSWDDWETEGQRNKEQPGNY